MFTFTPLLGAQSNSHASQSILELDGGTQVLVDVGWDESFDPRLLAELERSVRRLANDFKRYGSSDVLTTDTCRLYPSFYSPTPLLIILEPSLTAASTFHSSLKYRSTLQRR